MADIDGLYRRRIHIAGKIDNLAGYALRVVDAKTGERIDNILSIQLDLRASCANVAKVKYHDAKERCSKETEAEVGNIMLAALETLQEDYPF